MKKKKTIALVAHDNRKTDLIDWVEYNWKELISHDLVCTGTTGSMVSEVINKKCLENNAVPPSITRFKSGPLGGDQQLGALIAEGKVDIFIFLWDPMQPQPHDVDVKALLRICALYNVVTATNRSTADFVVSSELFHQDYKPDVVDYSSYINRFK
ncbi:methylglyoxal synthase [Carboxylicivirga caseinilyticus]|uniref:methylglyoxal synthase n=1 Tax=Carboxylicivirga caseinilyticus TaxID=3417572 RepID=UPI003D34F7FA|nr:methylglyoxal synthase [Marinilabiliaceae bacterium A049]